MLIQQFHRLCGRGKQVLPLPVMLRQKAGYIRQFIGRVNKAGRELGPQTPTKVTGADTWRTPCVCHRVSCNAQTFAPPQVDQKVSQQPGARHGAAIAAAGIR